MEPKMKKIFLALLAGAFFVGFATLSFAEESKSAQPKLETVRGEIVSIDAANNQVTIKQAKTNEQKTISVEPKDLSVLKVGEHVKAKLQSGSTKAESISVIHPRKGNDKQGK